MRDPYQVLGVARDADKETIRKAYKKLAKQWHPDLHPPDKQAEAAEKFKEVNSAFEALENPQPKHKHFTSPMDDIFSNFFGGAARHVPVGEHIIVDCRITLLDVLHGGKKELKYRRRNACKVCHGAGGTETVCDICNGTGFSITHAQMMTVKTACHGCNATGKKLTNICSHCIEGFNEGQQETMVFDIPQGVENGMRFSYRGMGHPAPSSGIAGNLYVQVLVEPDNRFVLTGGGNILCHIDVTYTQLVLGAELDVPTLEEKVAFKIPAGTYPGQKFRLKELGLPVFSNRIGGIYTRGDQLVEVGLKVPTNLTDKHRKAIEKLAVLEKEADSGRS